MQKSNHKTERKKCACGYVCPFCSCGQWNFVQEKMKQEVIKWGKFNPGELINFLFGQKQSGHKLSPQDEQLLNAAKY